MGFETYVEMLRPFCQKQSIKENKENIENAIMEMKKR
jgi:hypothetical protein